MRRIIVGVSGASGSAYAFRALQALKEAKDVETHLVISTQARRTIELETERTVDEFEELADRVYADSDLAAPISSGSFLTDGMLVVPCSTRSAAAIAYSIGGNLLVRAADVCLKEKRKLVLAIRESPLHLGHLRSLTQLAEMGAVILPPLPALYMKPRSIDDVIAQAVGKLLDQFGVEHQLLRRWGEKD